jgi:hypothetical protein
MFFFEFKIMNNNKRKARSSLARPAALVVRHFSAIVVAATSSSGESRASRLKVTCCYRPTHASFTYHAAQRLPACTLASASAAKRVESGYPALMRMIQKVKPPVSRGQLALRNNQ